MYKTLGTPALSLRLTRWIQVKAIIPYCCHLLNPLQLVSMKGRRQVKDVFVILETIERWNVCVPLMVNGQDKRLSAFEWGIVVGVKRTSLNVSTNCNAAGFYTLNSFLCVSRMIHHPKDIQPTQQNCGKHCIQHGPASLWNAFDSLYSPCPDELSLFWGQNGVQLNIREVVPNVLYRRWSDASCLSGLFMVYVYLTAETVCVWLH